MSNYYGYISLDNVPFLKERYNVASPATWVFLRKESFDDTDGSWYGGVEDVIFNESQKTEIERLGGGWFEGGEKFNEWLHFFGFFN